MSAVGAAGTTQAAAGLDPRTKLGLLACLGLLAVTFDRPASLGLLALVCAAPLPLLRVERVWLRRGALAIAAVVWSTVLSQALFYSMLPRTPVLSLGPLVLFEEGIRYGLVQSLRFVALTLGGLAVVASTPVDRMMAGLLRLRVPFGLAFLALTALRFVPDTARELMVVREARARRGRPAHHRSPWAWLVLEVSMLRPVVARSLRRARVLAETLDTRGFDPLAPRAVRKPLRMRPWELGLLGGVASITLAAVSARLLFVLYTADVLWFPHLRPLYGFVRHWL